MTIIFRGGRRPAEPARLHLAFGNYAVALPAPPASADWLNPVPASAWGMLGNDVAGDCTCAGVAHKRIGDVYVNQGTVLKVDTAQALAFYTAITGYDPTDPNTDQGAVCQDVLDYWRKHGFLGEKIVAFAKVDLSNQTQVKQAITLFGQIYCGFNFPDYAMSQFNNGQRWDVVKGAPAPRDGHCVTVGAYDETELECVTWGAVQKLTWAFFRKYFDEGWVIVTPDMIDPKSGKDISGFDLYTLGTDFAALTGAANPVPQPQPVPVPTPPPAPTPAPNPRLAEAAVAAQELADLMRPWAPSNNANGA